MILWGRPSSVNVQKVLWGLDELGLSYDHKIVGGKYGGTDDPVFAALTPVRRVPVLQDGDLALWESHVILRHLARREGKLNAPESVVDMWMEFGSTTLQPPFIGVFWQKVRMLPEDRDAAAEAAHLSAMKTALSQLETGISDGRAYIAGDEFSVADVALGSLFYRIIDLCPGILDDLPNVTAWQARIASRPAYQRHIATSYDELKVS